MKDRFTVEMLLQKDFSKMDEEKLDMLGEIFLGRGEKKIATLINIIGGQGSGKTYMLNRMARLVEAERLKKGHIDRMSTLAYIDDILGSVSSQPTQIDFGKVESLKKRYEDKDLSMIFIDHPGQGKFVDTKRASAKSQQVAGAILPIDSLQWPFYETGLAQAKTFWNLGELLEQERVPTIVIRTKKDAAELLTKEVNDLSLQISSEFERILKGEKSNILYYDYTKGKAERKGTVVKTECIGDVTLIPYGQAEEVFNEALRTWVQLGSYEKIMTTSNCHLWARANICLLTEAELGIFSQIPEVYKKYENTFKRFTSDDLISGLNNIRPTLFATGSEKIEGIADKTAKDGIKMVVRSRWDQLGFKVPEPPVIIDFLANQDYLKSNMLRTICTEEIFKRKVSRIKEILGTKYDILDAYSINATSDVDITKVILSSLKIAFAVGEYMELKKSIKESDEIINSIGEYYG